MKVLALAADEGGCGFYRIREPARVAKELGVDVEVRSEVSVVAAKDWNTGLTKVTEVCEDVDLIISQRPLDNAFTSLLQQARRQGIATIVEVDDDFDHVHRQNIAHKGLHENSYSGPHWLRAAAAEADLVQVSTPALERYAPHGRSEVIRNCVPESIFDVTPAYEREPADKLKLGWSGTVQTHPVDLQTTRGNIAKLVEDNNLRMHIVGDGTAVLRTLGMPPSSDMTITGWVDLDRYYDAVADIDLGFIPLDISPFNQAKSALKGMEMAALGIPFAAAPTREYVRLEAYGVGKVVNTPGDWRKHLQRWIDRPDERLRNAKQYREIIYNEMTYERNAQRWISAWEKAIAHRKSNS